MTDKYYYVKPKAKPRISYGRTAVVEPTDNQRPPEVATLQVRTQIMDLAFVGAQAKPVSLPTVTAPARSVGWLQLIVVAIFGVALYAGGVGLYAGASQIKADTVGTVTKAVAKIDAAAQAVTLKNLPEARANLITAENLFASAQKDILSLGQTNLYMSGLAGERFQIITGQKLIDAGLNLAQGGQLLIATVDPALQYLNGKNNPNGATANGQAQDLLPQIIQVFSASSRNLDKALVKVAKADSLLQSIAPDALGPDYETALKSAQLKASALNNAVAVLDTLAKQLPRALGDPNPRSYLILNQNDTELRPTGGFMGSYGIVKLHHGKITDFYVDDTYRIDGQLVGPESKEKVIPNANFNPDFPATARYVSRLYEQSGGGTPDGVIAINTQVMGALLKIIGNIELPNRKLTITPDNFAQVVYGEIQKVEKTSNPKAILSELSPILLERVTSMTRNQLNQLTPLLLQQIAEKNIMLYTRNADLQRVIAEADFAGNLHETLPKQDYLMVVRANMGAMKSSYNINDDIQHQVVISDTGTITEKLTLHYSHTGTNSLPDGTNKDYVRVYLPKGTVAKNVIGYDVTEKLDTETVHDKTYFGFYVTTEPGETKTVVIDYQLPFTINLEKGEQYSLYVQKQSGTINTTLESYLKTPDSGLNLKELFKGRLVTDINL